MQMMVFSLWHRKVVYFWVEIVVGERAGDGQVLLKTAQLYRLLKIPPEGNPEGVADYTMEKTTSYRSF